ncbi:MAG: response regulator transcription factor [Planctomycetes bacterium]|nr:response regulator transcription factor [Planctomycetota bacterium]
MNPRPTAFVIDDEPSVVKLIVDHLENAGFDVRSSTDGAQGMSAIFADPPDVVLLDIMLPREDGFLLCTRLREDLRTENVPILMVTGCGEEQQIVRGLTCGADDYLPKPFSPNELVARAQALLRRRARAERARIVALCGGRLVLDLDAYTVQVDREAIAFTATEFRLLRALTARPGKVFTRRDLLQLAIGEDVVVVERNIDVHIRAIRRKLGDELRHVIRTERGIGYRFDPFALGDVEANDGDGE